MKYNLNTLSILDGGSLTYFGTAERGEYLTLNLTADLMIRGGGLMTVNKLKLTGGYRVT